MPGIAPSVDEILRELEAASIAKRVDGARTLVEWASEWAMSENKARTIIKHAIITGRMAASTEHRPSVMRPGCLYATQVYAFKGQA